MADKAVFISGASRGIGQQTAFRFARAGYKVAVAYNTGADLARETAMQCEELGAPETLILHLDLEDDQSISEAAAAAIKHFGQITVLVNSAGVLVSNPLRKLSFSDISQQLRINLEGLVKLTRELLPCIQEAIINVGSSLALRPKKNLSIYVASKFGVRGFTGSLARELPQLRLYTVNPGLTATQMGSSGGMDPAKVAEVIFNAAVGRYRRSSGSDINVRYYVLSPLGKIGYGLRWIVKKIIGR